MMYPNGWHRSVDEIVEERQRRDLHTQTLGYAKLSEELVTALLPYSPYLEIGAGTGALAAAITKAGGQVTATDNYSSHGEEGWHGSLFEVQRLEAEQAVTSLKDKPGVNLLCAWPSYDEPWCARAIKLLPKHRIYAYVGEDRYGCTGDDQLFTLLEEEFNLLDLVPIPQWFGVHDTLNIYQKR